MNAMRINTGFLLVLSIFQFAAAKAQTYKPPILASDPVHDSREAGMNVEVERTDSGAQTHLKVTLTVPPTTPDVKAYTRIFFYGWLVTSTGQNRKISQCTTGARCPEGFPVKRGPFTPGDRVTIETIVPKSFVEASGAHLHIGIGGKKYYPTQNLLSQK